MVGYYFHMYVSDTAYLHKSLFVFPFGVFVCVCVHMHALYFEIFMHSDLSVFSLLTSEDSSHLESVSAHQILKYTLHSSNTKSPYIYVSFLCFVLLIYSSILIHIILFNYYSSLGELTSPLTLFPDFLGESYEFVSLDKL